MKTISAQADTKYAEFSDPRLVAMYDAVCPIDSYADFFLDLAEQISAESILDIGCGTGLLSHEFAMRGYKVIGIEPASEMLRQARRKYGTEAQWVVGSTEELNQEMQGDLAIMTGHVAQFFLEDAAWQAALVSMYRALKPGGYLAFDSRNPQVQPFTGWPTKQGLAK